MKKLTTDGELQELDIRVARMSAAEYATHFIYTEGVRSSSLLPPKPFNDQAKFTCH
jgi:hypothetical protein